MRKEGKEWPAHDTTMHPEGGQLNLDLLGREWRIKKMKGIPSSMPSKGFTLNRKELMSAAVVNIHLSSRVVDRGEEWSGVPSESLGTVESFQAK